MMIFNRSNLIILIFDINFRARNVKGLSSPPMFLRFSIPGFIFLSEGEDENKIN